MSFPENALHENIPADEIILGNREKSKQQIRQDRWQSIKDSALANISSASPLPMSLDPTTSIVPLGTFKPDQDGDLEGEGDSFEDLQNRTGFEDEDEGVGQQQDEQEQDEERRFHLHQQQQQQIQYQQQQQQDDHDQMLLLQQDQELGDAMEDDPRELPAAFPEQQQQQSQNVRRKSVIPLDPAVLRELASHKSYVPSRLSTTDGKLMCVVK